MTAIPPFTVHTASTSNLQDFAQLSKLSKFKSESQVVANNKIDGVTRLDDLSTDPLKMKEMNEWIHTKGSSPEKKLTELMEENVIIVMGEDHDRNRNRLAGSKYIEALALGGMTHLALEMNPQDQPGLDEFVKTGDTSRLPLLVALDTPDYVNTGYLDMLVTARKLGIKLVAVDDMSRGQDQDQYRNQTMASGVIKLIEANPHAKVVLWVGDNHSSKTFRTDGTSVARLSVPEFIKKNKAVSDKGVVTIATGFHHRYWAPWITQVQATQPVMVPSKNAPYAEWQLNREIAGDQAIRSLGKSADYQIIYPRNK